MDRMISWEARVKRAFPFADRFIFNSMETVIKHFDDGLHEAGEDAERLACLWLKKRGFNVWRSATGSRADTSFKTDILAFNSKTGEVWVVQVKAGLGLANWIEFPRMRWIVQRCPDARAVFITVDQDSGKIAAIFDDSNEVIVDNLKEVMQNEKA